VGVRGEERGCGGRGIWEVRGGGGGRWERGEGLGGGGGGRR